MAKQLQLRRGTTAQHSTFTGAAGEVTVDTTLKTLRVHDNVKVGGNIIATTEYVDEFKADLANPDTGAAMVGRGVVAVDSIADLLTLSPEQRKEGLRYLVKGYHAGSAVGGGEFYWDESRVSENDGMTIFNGFVRNTSLHLLTAEDAGVLRDDSSNWQRYFDCCDGLEIAARFPNGTWELSNNVIIPSRGLEGVGMHETVILVDPSLTGHAMYFGNPDTSFNDWGRIRGSIKNLTITSDSPNYSGVLLAVDTPSRGTEIDNVYFGTGAGYGIKLIYSYYLRLSNCVFSGPFFKGIPTVLKDKLVGVGVLQAPGDEVNNISFEKCDWRYLEHAIVGSESHFSGSNTINFDGCAIEFMGNTALLIPGWKCEFNSCYFESLARNRELYDVPVAVAQCGTLTSSYNNCLINLGGVPSGSSAFLCIAGIVELNGGSVNGFDSTVNIIKPITYSTRGILVSNNCNIVGLDTLPAVARTSQQHTKIYPFSSNNNDVFSNQLVDAEYARDACTLGTFSSPLPPAYSLNKQSILGVSVSLKDQFILFSAEIELTRFMPDTSDFGSRKYTVRGIIPPDCPDEITLKSHFVHGLYSGANTGFTDAEEALGKKLKLKRITSPRIGMDTIYHSFYELVLSGELGTSYPRTNGKTASVYLQWVYGGETKPSFGIYKTENFPMTPKS